MGIFTKAENEQVIATVSNNPVSPYLMLDEKDFACLVRGGVLHVGNLRIALRDIGFDQMNHAIEKAQDGIEIYKDHVKETGLNAK